jgi:hypothetical protein
MRNDDNEDQGLEERDQGRDGIVDALQHPVARVRARTDEGALQQDQQQPDAKQNPRAADVGLEKVEDHGDGFARFRT